MASQQFGQVQSNPDVQKAKTLFNEARAFDKENNREGANRTWKEFHQKKQQLKKSGISMPIFHHVVSGRALAPSKRKVNL